MLDVVCAVLVDFDRRILIAQRALEKSLGGMWEFPGGKIEAGEDHAAALMREIDEELGCTVLVGASLNAVEHDYPGFSIRLHPYFCTLVSGTPERREHAAIRWIETAEIESIDWAGADLFIAREVRRHLESRTMAAGSAEA